MCESRIIIAPQSHRRAKRDANPARPNHSPALMEHLLHPVETNRNDGHIEPRSDHADAPAEGSDRPGLASDALRKNQDRPVVAYQVAHVMERMARTDLALRDREAVEVKARKVI